MRLTGTPSWLNGSREGQPARSERRPPRPTRVWALGGGKGGIGKSFLVANMAATAARSGRRVIAIDADLGGANLHTCLGVRPGERVTLSDYLEERVEDLEKAALETPVPGLRLIAGAISHTGTVETSHELRARLVAKVRELSADLVIFDLAAGTDRSTLDFFLEADESVLVTTPEPTAVENVYAFLRAAFYRRLGHAMRTSPVRELLRTVMDQRNAKGIRSPSDLLSEVSRIDADECARFRKMLDEFHLRLIVNQVRTTEEVKLGYSVRSVCRKYFGLDVDYVGYINYDDCVWRSIKERRPLVLGYPESDGALYVRQIVKKMLRS